ncbi:MAG: ankyrin repeat domain-containing protein [Magnetococcus sp. WYHC-3]
MDAAPSIGAPSSSHARPRGTDQPAEEDAMPRRASLLLTLLSVLLCLPGAIVAEEGGKLSAPDAMALQLRRFAMTGQLRGVKSMIEKGAIPVDAPSRNGMTPLMWAAQEGHGEVVEYLIAKGANVNAQHLDGVGGALLYAIEGLHAPVVKILLDHGANPHATESAGQTMLVKLAGLNLEDRHDRQRQMLIVNELISHGARINETDFKGRSPLMLAALRNNATLVALLVTKGADVNLEDRSGNTALMVAAKAGWEHIVHQFIANGALMGRNKTCGCTPLMVAAEEGHTLTVELLVRYGANLDEQDSDGFSALMLAAMNNRTETAEKLLKAGANPLLVNAEGQTAQDLARRNGHTSLVGLLAPRAH